MTVLLEIKEKLKSIYAEYSFMILLILKFLLAFVTFSGISKMIGFWEPINNMFLLLILSLLCSLFSVKAIAVFSGLLILGNSYVLGLEVFGVTGVFFLILFLFFLRFDETDGLAFVLTPLTLALGAPAFVPICYGLKKKPESAVSIACGAVVYHYVMILSEKASILQNAEEGELLDKMVVNLRILTDSIVKNRQMFLVVVALILVSCFVYVVRRLSIDYVWQIAIVVGAVVYLMTMIVGGMILDIDVVAFDVVLGTIVSVVLALIMEFLVLNVDYSRTERIEFEDDEYYYYVKAVPKITISKPQRQVKEIDDGEVDFQQKLEESLNEL